MPKKSPQQTEEHVKALLLTIIRIEDELQAATADNAALLGALREMFDSQPMKLIDHSAVGQRNQRIRALLGADHPGARMAN